MCQIDIDLSRQMHHAAKKSSVMHLFQVAIICHTSQNRLTNTGFFQSVNQSSEVMSRKRDLRMYLRKLYGQGFVRSLKSFGKKKSSTVNTEPIVVIWMQIPTYKRSSPIHILRRPFASSALFVCFKQTSLNQSSMKRQRKISRKLWSFGLKDYWNCASQSVGVAL